MPNILIIEDDDGFKTEWPWPEDASLLAHTDFIALHETQHEILRQQQKG